MAILYSEFSDSLDIVDITVGFHLEEGVTSSGNIPVREVVYADYLSVQTLPSFPLFLSAIYVPLVFVQSFNPLTTKMFGGNPVVYRFGTLVANHYGTYGVRQFIQYEKQQFPLQELLVYPESFDFPDSMSALPAPEAYDYIARANVAAWNTVQGKVSPYTGALSFNYDLEPGVIANIGFFYYLFVANVVTVPDVNAIIVAI